VNMPVNPLILATMAESAIKKLMDTIYTEQRQISQLMVGRTVQHPRVGNKFIVTQVTIDPAGRAVLHGTKRKASKVTHTIGPLQTIEIVEPKP
jgi:hypothetical protein